MYYVSNDYLMHYGILGQKWGIRRFQNPDGTRTAAGKRRERSAEEKAETRAKIKRGIKIGAAATGAAAVAGASVVGLAKYANDNKYATTGSVGTKHLSDYSDEELKNKVQRQNLERKYKENIKAKDKTQDVFNAVNQINNASSQAVGHLGRIAKATRKEPPKPDYSHLSDEELRKRINRLQMEKQYSQLNAEYVNAGKRSADRALDIAGGVVGLAGTAATIALAINALYKKV